MDLKETVLKLTHLESVIVRQQDKNRNTVNMNRTTIIQRVVLVGTQQPKGKLDYVNHS